MKKGFFRRLRKSERGASVIEFVIVLPILLTLVMGIIDFGWLLNGYIAVNGAAREGARTAVALSDNAVSNEDIITAAENHLGYLKDLLIGLNIDPGAAASGDERTVEVKGSLSLLVGFFPFVDDPFLIEAKATMRQESVN